MAMQLNIKNVKKRESDDYLKNVLAEKYIEVVFNNEKRT